MSQRRFVHVASVDPDEVAGIRLTLSRIDPSGGPGACVLDDQPIAELCVPPEQAASRARVLGDLRRAESVAADSYLVGDPRRDARARTLESALQALADWDFRHLLRPLLSRLSDRPALLVYLGSSPLDRLDLRSAQRAGVRGGSESPSCFDEVVCVPTWPEDEESFVAHLAKLCVSGLPVVRPTEMTLLLGPSAPNAFLGVIAHLRAPDQIEILRETPEETRALHWRERLRNDLPCVARGAGVQVIENASFRDVLLASERFGPNGTLGLVAHQDAAGVHLEGGPVPSSAFSDALSRARPSAFGNSSIDLGVCGAAEPSNLAHAFQRSGATAVLTRGRHAYEGRVLARWTVMMRLLASGHEASLPELHDRSWLVEIEGSRMGKSS